MSDTPIERFLPLFAQAGVPVAFLVPTPTGFGKSIMDATTSVRQLFLNQGLHDYDLQQQGPANKVLIQTFLVTDRELIPTETSLYRPVTKMGDPRLWIYNLKSYCAPRNLLALIVMEGSLYVFNLSDNRIADSLFNGGFCYDVLCEAVHHENLVAEELRLKIQEAHNQGFLRSVTRGDPGVGDTLEHALGLVRNNRQTPDYKGIELKASRRRLSTPNRCTLFDKTPDWRVAMSEREILDTFGYWGEDDNGARRFQLYCTLTSRMVNSQGLTLEYNEPQDSVDVIHATDRPRPPQLVTSWDMQVLRNRLLEKHPATFWVKASVNVVDGWEYFRYDHIKYTRNPNISLFAGLIADGIVSVDFLMHYKPNGMVRDHGFPFKIMPQNVNLLFPEVIEYDLTR